MNYIGSKLKLSSWIEEEVKKVVGDDLSQKIFCDIFAGTGIVGRTFKKNVKKVIANDLEDYSYVLNRNYIGNHEAIVNKEYFIEELNNLPLINTGFIYKNYCMGSGSQRQYFSDENGKKIDTIRTQIENWKVSKKIDDDLYYIVFDYMVDQDIKYPLLSFLLIHYYLLYKPYVSCHFL